MGACTAAAGKGRLGALRWLRSCGCPWNGDACYEAARGGHLEVLRYAHEHGCPWDDHTCWGAAREGHLEVLRYAHEHGCPMDVDEGCDVAEENGHAAVVEYLRAAQPAA